jgi:eukaryotic-like serine/threonine-protein kinase
MSSRSGTVLYEMLTGRHPFIRDTVDATIVSIVGTTPAPPSAINPAVPSDLDAVVLRALAKDIDARQQSAATLSAELRSIGAVLDIRAGDAGPGELLPLGDEPERGAGFWIGIFVVLTIVAAVVWWWVVA